MIARDLGVPSVSFNALTGHRSCAPEDYRGYLRTPRQGPVPVSCVFPAGSDSRLLETRLQAIRLSPYRADLPARRPVRIGSGRRFPGMLLSPVTFQITGQPSDPKTPPPVHARSAGYIAVRLVAHADHPVMAGRPLDGGEGSDCAGAWRAPGVRQGVAASLHPGRLGVDGSPLGSLCRPKGEFRRAAEDRASDQTVVPTGIRATPIGCRLRSAGNAGVDAGAG